ncbi:MAG: hypothetical protein U1G07_17175 [Verrucomicrobiota bacterium]
MAALSRKRRVTAWERQHKRLMNRRASQEKELFAAALELRVEERAPFLKEACGTDAALMKEVQDLLDAYFAGPSVFRTALVAEPAMDNISESPGSIIGRYKLLQKIGEGEWEINIYMAEQTEPVRRRVAFKIIKLGMDTRQSSHD